MRVGKKKFSWIALIVFILIAFFIGFALMMVFSTDFAIKITSLQQGIRLDAAQQQKLIVVNASGSAASVTCLEAKDGRYAVAKGMQGIKAIAGINGIKDGNKREDGCTPSGLFLLSQAFGAAESIDASIPYEQTNPQLQAESENSPVSLIGKQEYELYAAFYSAGDETPLYIICFSDELKAQEAQAQAEAQTGKEITPVGTDGSIAMEKKDIEQILVWAEPDNTYMLIMK